ncbi:MAG: DUF4234 domain-containing protein [Thermoleophilia bacterium]|nr:DUF4234 domain-containing protein [Thermoleophilia bacterium]
MAHLVQAGNARPKVRSGWGVWLLGIITGGIYSAWWWHRTSKDLAEFESSDGSESTINAARESGIVAAMVAVTWVAQIVMREEVPATSFDGTATTTTAMTAEGSLVMFACTIGLLVMAGRMRSNVKRVMTRAGMLPEEQPGGFLFWVGAFLLSVPGSSGMLQTGLNKLWERYPRWYESIGGTKEEFGAAPTPIAVGGTAPIGAPMQVQQQLPAQLAAAAGMPAATPIAGGNPSAVLAELGPRAQAGALDAASAFRYAQAVEQVHGAEQASQWYRFVANTDPSNAQALYWTGSYLVGRGDESGMAYLHRAAQDASTRAAAANQLASHLERMGRSAEAAQWRSYATAA